jgi:predicted Zn-dependent peptidase
LKRSVRREAGRPRTVRERQEVGQAKLELGFRVPGSTNLRRHAALVLMNAIFGGSPVAKLFKNVREKESLCYSVGSVFDRTKGVLVVHAGIEEKEYARARRLILAQLEDLGKGRISDEEDLFTRGLLASGLRTIYDSPGGLIEFALERSVNGLPPDLDGFTEALAAVSRADIARAARAVDLDTVYLLAGKGA